MNKKLQLDNLQENVMLASFTTFKIGGPSRYFVCVKTKEEIMNAIGAAKDAKIPFFILGGGSNLLISDQGYDGLIVKIENYDFEKLDNNCVRCGAGLAISSLMHNAKEMNLGGMEFMAGIPGTIGGAICGNAGAWGRGIGEIVQEVTVYKDSQLSVISHDDIGFAYRGSSIKENNGVIIETVLAMVSEDKKLIQNKIYEIIKKRCKLEVSEPSAGCVFKNIDLKKIRVDKEKIKHALDLNEEEYIIATSHEKLPVGFLMDKLGFKGKTMGGAKLSEKHGAYIVNTGSAKADDVVMLMSYIKTKVRNLLGIQLEEEIRLVGFSMRGE